MRTSELLARLRELDVKLWVDGTELGLKAPKGALTPELVREIKAKKSELLGLLGKRVRPGREEAPEIVRVARDPGDDAPLPLSFSQRRLWFLDQLEPDTTAYNMPLAWTLRGPLRVETLARALSEVVRRHEILRTRFVRSQGTPGQLIDPLTPIDLVPEEAPGDTVASRRASVRSVLSERAAEPFDLEAGGLLRPSLFRLADDEHVLFLLIHHIVFDGWSADVLLREVAELYEAETEGRPAALPELPIQYADVAAWQERYLESAELGRQLANRREALAGELPVLDLPTDRPRPSIQAYHGANLVRPLAPAGTERLSGLARSEGATTYMALLAVYNALLLRWTGQEDSIVGTIVANRNRPATEGLIGFFANTLVLRTDLSGDPSFRTLLARVREVALSAFENQDVPFERLVEELSPERNLSYTPLFQTLFMTEDEAGKGARMGEVELELLELEARVARTDLMLTAHQKDGGYEAWVEYSTDIFDGATIERLLDGFERLITAVVDEPDAPLSELAILTSEERSQVVSGWNDTAAEFPAKPIHARFEEQTDRTPDATAVLFPDPADSGGDLALTYRELDAASNRLARHLVAQGVAARTLVGLALDRSAEMIVAQLAIQKAGAAYVPLDPTYPADRLAHMVEDSGLTACVTTSELVGLLPAGIDAIELDRLVDELASLDSARLELEVAATDRMYVIYTSGSTGRPKGVELEHRSVSNFLSSMAREPGFCAGESLLAVTTLSFDISVLETMLPLMVGGTVIVAPREAVGDGQALIDLVERLRPDAMQATPATWRMMLLSGWEGSDHLRAFCGGEALPRELADDVLPRAQELWNLYGPTETTIWSAVKRVEAGAEPITIGHPIACTQMYVLDRNNQPVPIGVPGELFIGGDGLARGYLERPELTEERFVPDPFAGDGARMYRTGDKARWLATGELECLGRIDTQVKLRGFRIELGEIESVLSEVEGVDQCVCVIREDTPGDQRLTAYHVGPDSSGVETGVLRDAAQARLPAYMVPAAFVALEELPLTPNGKVDRKALLALEAARLDEGAAYVAPRDESERRIAEIWAGVLGLERVGVDTNFFELGGHSLLLAQVHGRLQESVDPAIKIIELFQYPTVGSLAARIATREEGFEGDQKNARTRNLAAGRQALMQRRRIRR